jgi:tetratricopeptide (TPR) repeat protein
VNPSASPAGSPPDEPRWRAWLAGGAIAVAGLAAYWGSFTGGFLYDDAGSIVNNPTIRSIGSALFPPSGGLPVSGRPIANFTFGLNYAAGGLAVGGYHAVNLGIHILGGLVLWGIARRTLGRTPGLSGGIGGHAEAAAFLIALLWTVDPLQTEAVTYISQRAESLMGLWYLLALYCLIRHSGSGGRAWAWLCFLSCLLGMATKEVMATAPVVLLLYDRAFLAGSLREAWGRRKGLYLALAGTWLLLGALVGTNADRGGTAGFGSSIPWWAYAFTQFRAVARYLRLCVWPHPLIFDYGLILGGPRAAMLADILAVSGLAVATVVLLRRNSPLGFLGAWFFLILSPSSSVVPVATEIIAEHRVYLSLAAVLAALVCGGYWAAARMGWGSRTVGAVGLLSGLAAAAALTAATVRRNRVYADVLTLWGDTARKVPESAGALNNYGNALAERGRIDEAIAEFRAALAIAPDYDDPHYNLANALTKKGRWAEAADHYRAALRFRPDQAAIHYGLGSALWHLGRRAEAEEEYERAMAARSSSPEVWYNLGNAFLDADRVDLAADAFGRAVRLRPDYADALANEAGALAQLNRGPEAILAFQAALRLEPSAADLHNNLGGLLAEGGRLAEARAEFEEALRLKPDYAEARQNLERVEAMERGGAGP